MANIGTYTVIDQPWAKNTDVFLALGIVGIVMIMIMPLPPILLDLLLSFSITLSLIILLVAVYILQPMEFSVFPSLLLVVTIFRLSLNVASTRLILLHGHEGNDAAGQVIKSFGEFVVGGNYTVGIIVFSILVIINFVVITKGAGRIAEVTARFTLDAMPGKQMSLDAELNAGLIDEVEAKRKRARISKEADFYGAMDGASKFVRGDAIAAIIITLVNIVGGLGIGLFQQGMPLVSAAQNYTLLTIGDSLVSQIPALIISTSAGIIVSRAASESHLGAEISQQIFVNPKVMISASGILFLLCIVPGLPNFAFFILACLTGIMAYVTKQGQEQALVKETQKKKVEEKSVALPPERTEDLLTLDLMELNVGYRLVYLVDQAQNGELLSRIRALRRQFAQEMGIMVPPIHIRDNLQLNPNAYNILVKGIEAASGEMMPGHLLAMDPGTADKGFPGISTKEPAFGLPALWIEESNKERAQLSGFTVVDISTVIATHITEIVRTHAHEFVGRQEVQSLLDNLSTKFPKVVEELIPNLLPLGGVVRVLQNLLKERIPIRDFRSILEILADHAPLTKDTDLLTESVRQGLARTITKQFQAPDGSLALVTLDPKVEQKITEALSHTQQGTYLSIDPNIAQRILFKLKQSLEVVVSKGYTPTVLCGPLIRSHFKKMTERFIPNLVVLSPNEIGQKVKIQTLGVVKLSDEDKEI